MATSKPTRHVYFGPKDPNTGEMMEEPLYVHQEFPKTLYRDDGDGGFETVVAVSAAEVESLGKEWVDSPAKLGFVTHPDQASIKAKAEADRASRLKAKKGIVK